MKIKDIPSFGSLSDVQVVFTGINVACPFAAELMAENGARTICLENAKRPDTSRMHPVYHPNGFLSERKNMLGMNLALGTEEGNRVFLDLMKTTDIFIEGNKGEAFAKMGLTDELMWAANPKLVIVHVSGYGQTGDPAYVHRPSFDPVGQAFGGIMFLNGEPDQPPMRIQPMEADYYAALFACWSALAALHAAEKTGKGESIDCAQYETAWKLQYDFPGIYLNDGVLKGRAGTFDADWAGLGPYLCGDGERLEIVISGYGPMEGMRQAIGYEDPELDLTKMGALSRHDPVSMRFDQAIWDFCAQHTSSECEDIFNAHNVPCSRIHNIQTIQDVDHVKQRELFTEWEDEHFGTVKGVNVVPKMNNHPGKIWKGAPLWGEDNVDILTEMGYAQDAIDKLYADHVMTKTPPTGGYLK